MAWEEFSIRTEALTSRRYKVKAQSYQHALGLMRKALEENPDRFECTDVFEVDEAVKS